VTNNWYLGEVLDDPRYRVADVDALAARGSRAFHEYVPIAPTRRDGAGRIYRRIPYGPLVDVFVLDMRSAKDPHTANLEPTTDGGVLGREQTAWLQRELTRSRATWKVIAADLPIGLLVPDGAAWEGIANGDDGRALGRELDMARVLSFLKAEEIRNHVWLTADVHYTAAHHYSPQRAATTDFDPFWEVRLRAPQRRRVRPEPPRRHLQSRGGLPAGSAPPERITVGGQPVRRRGPGGRPHRGSDGAAARRHRRRAVADDARPAPPLTAGPGCVPNDYTL